MERADSTPPVDPRYAKSETYRNVLGDIIAANACPFCPENFRWHTKPILHQSGLWLITESFQPYENTKHHFLMIGQEHKETLSELTPEDLKSVLSLSQWATEEFNIPGGGLTMRFGDTLYTGATVKHLHAHYIVPQVENGQVSPVFFPIG